MRDIALPVGSLSSSIVAYIGGSPPWIFVALVIASVMLGVVQAVFPQESADRRDLWLAVLSARKIQGSKKPVK